MHQNLIIIGNWKMHLLEAEASALVEAVCVADESAPAHVSVGVCPPAVYLRGIAKQLEGKQVLLGAQDCHEAEQGAHTGHISAAMLEDCGCDFTLVGHSERRADDGETNTQVKAKAERAIAHGVHAVVCVGETQSERETGDYLQVIEKQLRASLPAKHAAADLTIAYEPVWAIGTGKTASLDDISEVHGHIKGIVSALQKEKEEDIPPRVIYGGSVNANNALEILSLPVVDGVLVGGASLDAESFSNIIRAASQAAGS